MKRVLKTKRGKLYWGDCRKVMKKFSENSVDTIITDPPYELGFMGKKWDSSGIAFQTKIWKEALRVAKPGAFLLAFGGTRTHHRLMCAIEDAGWKIRDCMMWVYGSGFPKSHNISKAIDKTKGKYIEGDESPNSRSRVKGDNKNYNHSKKIMLSNPQTLEALEWDGWGTALKPAYEPIIIAMKPIDGTFANNALTHGVAGLNIDRCRIITKEKLTRKLGKSTESDSGWKSSNRSEIAGKDGGRWPANVILDEEAGRVLNSQSGILKSGFLSKGHPYGLGNGQNVYGKLTGHTQTDTYGDEGGASRFFYCAKASKSERGKNNKHPTVKPIELMKYLCRLTKTPKGGTVLDPFVGSGTTILASIRTGRKWIGIERDKGYCKIALKRIKHLIHKRKRKKEEKKSLQKLKKEYKNYVLFK